MCGITAAVLKRSGKWTRAQLRACSDLVAHRGPDGAGEAFLTPTTNGFTVAPGATESGWTVGLAHRRLAILDLTEAGAQPMRVGDQLWIVHNGEVFNYVELRAELEAEGHRFISDTDTEVIAAAYAQWGTDCFARFRGMWGLVIIDGRERRAVLSRDRLGIKPLYVSAQQDGVAVVSEIKQLTALTGATLRPNVAALDDFLSTGYEDSARSFFAGVVPVPAGTWQAIDLTTATVGAPNPYWQPESITPWIVSGDDAAAALNDVLTDAVKIHLRSDVPVGFALSGGVDSGAVAAYSRAQTTESSLHSFSAVFPGHRIDEGDLIDVIRSHLGLISHKVTPTAGGFLEDIDNFVWTHDEPVGSLSQYAGYCVARLTRSAGVPVSLNGQGGDEVLAGYWQAYFVYLGQLLTAPRLGDLFAHIIGSLRSAGNPELWLQASIMGRRYLTRMRSVRAGVGESHAAAKLRKYFALDSQQRRVFEIREMYLPRLLKWDDRNFMASSVEGRYPFLDNKLIELVLAFHPDTLYRSGWTKEPLRRALESRVPACIARRRIKLGFETPQADWLRTALAPHLLVWLEGDSPIWSHVDRASMRRRVRWLLRGQESGATSEAVFRAYIADRWWRAFFGG